jgi:hypothetical protein
MGTQIRNWEQTVAKPRRGTPLRYIILLTFRFLSMFGRNQPGPAVTSTYTDLTSGEILFKYNSPEMMLRRLADYAFMVTIPLTSGIFILTKWCVITITLKEFTNC